MYFGDEAIAVPFDELIEDIEVHFPIGQAASLCMFPNIGNSLMYRFVGALMIGTEELPAWEYEGLGWFL